MRPPSPLAVLPVDDVFSPFFFLCLAGDGSVDSVGLNIAAADVLPVVGLAVIVSVFIVADSATFVVAADVSASP